MPQLSSLLDRFKPSAIVGVSNLAAELRHQGVKLYNFSIGEPDFATPAHICEAAIAAIHRGQTKYSPTDGSIALREAVQRKFKRDGNFDFSMEQIVATSGAKPLIADILRTITTEGDDIVLAVPAWTSHVGMVNLVGANPVFVETSQQSGFRMTPEKLAQAMSDRTRAVLLCAPSNPSGAVYSRDEMVALAEVLADYPNAWIISDDLYEHIVFDGERFHSILEVAPELADRTVLVNGVSKAYAMTGWRIGFGAGPVDLMNGVRKLMSQSTGCTCSISEEAAIAALDGPLDCVHDFVDAYQARRDIAVTALNQIDGIECLSPGGAFYLYPSCAALIGRKKPDGSIIESSSDVATYLLKDWSVATVPGSAFELDPHLRFSIATAEEEIVAGIAQISEAISALQ
jgi:aspartate aminotransferase